MSDAAEEPIATATEEPIEAATEPTGDSDAEAVDALRRAAELNSARYNKVNGTNPEKPIEESIATGDPTPTADPANYVTIIKSTKPPTVNKVYKDDGKGGLKKTAVANITEGIARRHYVPDAEAFASLLHEVTQAHNQVICPGHFNSDNGKPFHIVAEATLARMLGKEVGDADLGGIDEYRNKRYAARVKRGISPSKWMLLDSDNPPGMPEEWKPKTIQQRAEMLDPLVPGLSACERIELRGSSSRVHLSDAEPGLATHAWVCVDDPSKIELLRTYLDIVTVTHGLSFSSPRYNRKTGEVISDKTHRTVLDTSVWITGRLVFCAQPHVEPAGYTVADAGIKVVNRGGGPLRISHLKLPGAGEMEKFAKRTGTKKTFGAWDGHITSVGELTPDTEIEVKGVTKRLAEWLAGMAVGEKLRCEAPFRESQSEAAFIHKNPDGGALVYDVGNGVTYLMPGVRPTVDPSGNRLDNRVELVVRGDNELALLQGTIKALKDLEPAVYQRAGQLVSVIPHLKLAAGVDEEGKARTTLVPAIAAVEAVWLKPHLQEVIDFKKWIKKKNERTGKTELTIIPTNAPHGLAEQVLKSRSAWTYPLLAGVISTPTMRPDGTLLLKEGYDPATALYLIGAPPMPEVKENPTRQDALAALKLLNDELLVGFPFEDDKEWGPNRSVALSGLMTPVLRGAFRHAPLHAVTAPAARTGKSYYLEIVGTIAIGNIIPTVDYAPAREGEFDKTLAALLMQGTTIINIDNIETPLGGGFLCATLTQDEASPRILGASKAPVVSITSTTTYANGNNLDIMGDLTERVVTTSMNAEMERPSDRNFEANPRATAVERRGEFLAAILTIGRAYVVAGRPGKLDMPGFDGWSHTVRSALVWLGCDDPCVTTIAATTDDPKASERRALFAAIAVTGCVDQTFQSHHLIRRAELKQNEEQKALFEALMAVAGNKDGINSQRLGKWLNANRDIIAGGLKLIREKGTSGGSAKWMLKSVLKAEETPWFGDRQSDDDVVEASPYIRGRARAADKAARREWEGRQAAEEPDAEQPQGEDEPPF